MCVCVCREPAQRRLWTHDLLGFWAGKRTRMPLQMEPNKACVELKISNWPPPCYFTSHSQMCKLAALQMDDFLWWVNVCGKQGKGAITNTFERERPVMWISTCKIRIGSWWVCDDKKTGFKGDENIGANGLMKRDEGGGTLHSGDKRLWDDVGKWTWGDEE